MVENKLTNMIYEIRDRYVILDRHIAKICNIETRVLNQTIKRNINKFNSDMMFQLNKEELKYYKSQFVIYKEENLSLRRLPYAFTKDGIEVIFSLLKLKNSNDYNEIIRAFDSKNINNITILEKPITSCIHEIRGTYVILDYDLARLYQCTNGTKTINLAVKRNINKFPNDFMFQLTEEEYDNLRFQIETSSLENDTHGGRRYMPYAFTEEGVLELSTVLHTAIANKISVEIMRAFVFMKKYMSSNLIEKGYFKNMLLKHDNDIKLLKDLVKQLEEKKVYNMVFMNGQIYDAYSKIKEILSQAKEKLIIVDNYLDTSLFDIIKDLKVDVKLITKEKQKFKVNDIDMYNKEYGNLQVFYNNTYHDRFFILDDKIVYHCGASIKDAGLRDFAINLIQEEDVAKSIIKKANSIIG